MQNVSSLIARFLKERGVDRIYGLCGGHVQPIWDHAAQLGIRIIDVRDEGAAVHMAQAHRELSGTLGMALVTAGPGMTNAVTGIANAHVSRVPILIISGVPPRPQQSMGALQAIPQVEIVRPITRYAKTVSTASHVLRELDDALLCAEGLSGEPGPVFIDFPTDLLREKIPTQGIDLHRFQRHERLSLHPSPTAIQSAVRLLWGAHRPVVISGRGARGAQTSLLRLLDALRCVYLDTGESRGLVPEDHPAFMPAVRGRAMKEADVILTIGRTLDYQLGYGSSAVFQDARFVRIGLHKSEVRENRDADVEVWGSTPEVLEALLGEAAGRSAATDPVWIAEMMAENRRKGEQLRQLLSGAPLGKDGAMHPYRLLGCLRDALKPDAVVIADGGDTLSFARVALTGWTLPRLRGFWLPRGGSSLRRCSQPPLPRAPGGGCVRRRSLRFQCHGA